MKGICKKRNREKTISRILSSCISKEVVIYLGVMLPLPSSNLPEHIGRTALNITLTWSCSVRGLHCRLCRHKSGELLPRLFTLATSGGIFSVALSVSLRMLAAFVLQSVLFCGVRTFLCKILN